MNVAQDLALRKHLINVTGDSVAAADENNDANNSNKSRNINIVKIRIAE